MAYDSTSSPRPHPKRKLIETARERWKLATEADSKQRQRELDDLRFLVDHWSAELRASRQGTAAIGGMPATPARPTIQIDKLSEPISRVLNQERGSDIGIQVVPADDFADLGIQTDKTEINLREGLIRRIQRESEAADARTWAFQRAVETGRGYYLVMTRFLPKSFNKEVFVLRIYNQDAVRLDPAHEQPDGSDANWGLIGGWMAWDVYKATYPSKAGEPNRISDANEGEFADLAEPEWVESTTDKKAVFVVDYWSVQLTARTLALLPDGTSAWEDELPEGAPIVDRRPDVERKIHFCKLDGVNEFPLEETEWEGPDLPIVKVLGKEMQPYDSERRIQGMVRPARDAQFGFDAMVSKQVETVALTPIPALHVDPVAIEGYESWYALMNTRTLPYAPSRTYDDNGRQLAPPQRLNADPNLLPIAQSIALFDRSISDTTAVSDPSLGRTDPTVKSARHANALIDQSDLGTSHFLDNLIRSMRYEGQIINNLLYPIYGKRPGRLVRILTGEPGQSQSAVMRIAATPEEAQTQQTAQKVGVLTEDAKFNVVVKVSKSATTRRKQKSLLLGDMIAANPVFMTWFGDLFFEVDDDLPGHQQMAERAKLMLDPKIQAMLASKEKGQAPIPPEVQAKLKEQEERIQAAEQALQEVSKVAEGKQLESQTKVQVAQLQAERDLAVERLRAQLEMAKAQQDTAAKAQIADVEADKDLALQVMKNAATIAVAHISASAKGVALDAHAAEEGAALGHQAEEADRDRQHQVALTGAQSETQREDAEAQRQHEAALAEQQALHAAQQTGSPDA